MSKEKKPRPRVALSLGGGGAKTFAHLGVIDAFKKANVPIDYFVTCSAASIVVFISALGVPSRDIIKEFSRKRKWWWIAKHSLFKHILRSYLKEKDITDIKQANTPIAIVTVDLTTSKEIIFDQGDPLQIPLGSSAFPGIYRPIKYGKYYLVDGGVLNPDPANIARREVGSTGIVISVTLRMELTQEKPGNRFNTILRSLYMSQFMNRDEVIRNNSDLIIAPLNHLKISYSDLKETFLGYFDSDRIEEFYKKGYQTGEKASAEIKKLILDKTKPPHL